MNHCVDVGCGEVSITNQGGGIYGLTLTNEVDTWPPHWKGTKLPIVLAST